MKKFLIRRLVSGILVIWLVMTIVFILVHSVPGDPAQVIAGDLADVKTVEMIREKLGLNEPLWVQYCNLLKGMITGDIGNSFSYRYSAFKVVIDRIPATVELTLVGACLAIPISIFLGIISAVKRNSLLDHMAKLITLFGISTPSFWLGIMLILIFSVQLHWFPSMDKGPYYLPQAIWVAVNGNPEALWHWARYIILPGITLSAWFTALVARMTRTETLDNLNRAFTLTARSKGLGPVRVIIGHVLPNSLIPIITIAGIQIGILLGGALVTEAVFMWPGMGRLLMDSILARDFPMIQATTMVYAIIWVGINLLVDLIYVVIDPRLKLA
ncbi:MAG: ABC transporter permease [Thermodesulfobacteriota bacterium]